MGKDVLGSPTNSRERLGWGRGTGVVLRQVAGGTKVRSEERVALCLRVAHLLLKRTRVRQGRTFQDVEANKRYFQT